MLTPYMKYVQPLCTHLCVPSKPLTCNYITGCNKYSATIKANITNTSISDTFKILRTLYKIHLIYLTTSARKEESLPPDQ